MQSGKRLLPKQIAQLASYVKSLKGTKPPNPKEPQGELYKEETWPAPAADSATTTKSRIQPEDDIPKNESR